MARRRFLSSIQVTINDLLESKIAERLRPLAARISVFERPAAVVALAENAARHVTDDLHSLDLPRSEACLFARVSIRQKKNRKAKRPSARLAVAWHEAEAGEVSSRSALSGSASSSAVVEDDDVIDMPADDVRLSDCGSSTGAVEDRVRLDETAPGHSKDGTSS